MALIPQIFAVMLGGELPEQLAEDLHPAERELFELASNLGSEAMKITKSCINKQGPCETLIQKHVVTPYFEFLLEKEQEVSETCSHTLEFYNSVHCALAIVQEIHSNFKVLFKVSLQILQFVSPKNSLSLQMWDLETMYRDYKYTGGPEQDLIADIEEAVDMKWTSLLLEYFLGFDKTMPDDIKSYQDNKWPLISDIKRVLTQLADESMKGTIDTTEYLHLVEKITERFTNFPRRVSYDNVDGLLHQIEADIVSVITTYLQNTKLANDTLRCARDTILLKSIAFGDLFVSHNNFTTAFVEYLAQHEELALVSKCFDVKEQVKFKFQWPLFIMFPETSFDVYMKLSEVLRKLYTAISNTSIGNQKVSILVSQLWNWYQSTIDEQFDKMHSILNQPLTLNMVHDISLSAKALSNALLLEDKYFHEMLYLIFNNANAIDSDLISSMYEYISMKAPTASVYFGYHVSIK